jgi:hypothetical protein
MAESFDAAGRLAEGEPALADIQELVWATHLVGYQNPSLTADAGQIRDWYTSEDGLDLRVLDTDGAALTRVAAAAGDALARQDEQQAALSAVWAGSAAVASQTFLRRHAEASAVAVAAVRLAGERLTALRDELWRLVDAKAAATVTAAAEMGGQKAEWLAAAQTVNTGTGDRSQASELIDQQVKPFVGNVIGDEWLTAMRSTQQSVADAYDAATAELSGHAAAVFDVPRGVGPVWVPSSDDGVAATTPAAASVPRSGVAPFDAPAYGPAPAWSAPAAVPAAASMPAPMAPPGVDTAMTPPMDAPPPASTPAAPSLGAMPDVGAGLSGFGRQLADLLGGLIGSSDDPSGLNDGLDVDDPPDGDESPDITDADEEADGADGDDTGDGSEESDEPSDPDAPDDAAAVDSAGAETCDAPPAEQEATPVADPVEPAPTPVPDPPATPLVTPPPPDASPCEIAADELPQVGE